MKFNNTKVSSKQLGFALLLLRLCLAGLMIMSHGWPKIIKYEILKTQFYDFLGLGPQISLFLVIFSEIFCALLLAFGLYTRFVLVPLIITMLVAIGTHGWQIFDKAEMSFLYLIGFVFLLIVGPGAHSVDARMNKRSFY